MNDHKNLQNMRTMRYFIESTHKIIDTEGIENVTVRKVADLAGYNVATLYNYFNNLNHLIFFASLRCLKKYAITLPEYTKGISEPLALYLKIWECFNKFAFLDPHAYQLIFCGDHGADYNQSIKLYYDIFPEELPSDGLRFFPMLLENDLHKRDYANLKNAAVEGLLSDDQLLDISSINSMIFSGMLSRFLSSNNTLTAEEAAKITTNYQAHTLIGYGAPENLVKDFI